jgi:hypothetical protein
LLRRTFAIEVLHCDRCGRARDIISIITDLPAARAILRHLGLLGSPGPLSVHAARPPPGIRWFDPDGQDLEAA